jgi:peptidoglycan/xylan/chitin deacetylase (PgdA/CDA1 family)
MGIGKRITHFAISAVFFSVISVRDIVLRTLGGRPRRRSLVLYYHVIECEHRQRFAKQLDILLRHAIIVKANSPTPLDGKIRHVALTFDDASETVVMNALPELEKRGIHVTIFAISGLLGQQIHWGGQYSDRIVSGRQLASLNGDLVTIGSHTVTHPELTILPEAAARAELRDSREQLERLLQRPVTLFSFPYGAFDEALVTWAREAGYERVFTTLPMRAFEVPAQFSFGRVRVDPTDWPLEFRLKIMGAYGWLPAAIAVKRRLLGISLPHRPARSEVSPVTKSSTT